MEFACGLGWLQTWMVILLFCLQCGRSRFDPWVVKISWRRQSLRTPVFWPGEFHGLYSIQGHKESDTTEWLSLPLHFPNNSSLQKKYLEVYLFNIKKCFKNCFCFIKKSMQVSYTHIHETVQSDLLTAQKTRFFFQLFFCRVHNCSKNNCAFT